VELVVRWR